MKHLEILYLKMTVRVGLRVNSFSYEISPTFFFSLIANHFVQWLCLENVVITPRQYLFSLKQ